MVLHFVVCVYLSHYAYELTRTHTLHPFLLTQSSLKLHWFLEMHMFTHPLWWVETTEPIDLIRSTRLPERILPNEAPGKVRSTEDPWKEWSKESPGNLWSTRNWSPFCWQSRLQPTLPCCLHLSSHSNENVSCETTWSIWALSIGKFRDVHLLLHPIVWQ